LGETLEEGNVWELTFSPFSTVWYELIVGEWPFKGDPPEVIIWQVAKGVKQPLMNVHASKEIKVDAV